MENPQTRQTSIEHDVQENARAINWTENPRAIKGNQPKGRYENKAKKTSERETKTKSKGHQPNAKAMKGWRSSIEREIQEKARKINWTRIPRKRKGNQPSGKSKKAKGISTARTYIRCALSTRMLTRRAQTKPQTCTPHSHHECRHVRARQINAPTHICTREHIGLNHTCTQTHGQHSTYTYRSACTHVHAHTHTDARSVYIHVNIHIYIYIYSCRYIYIYIYIFMCSWPYIRIDIHTNNTHYMQHLAYIAHTTWHDIT